MGRVLGTGRSSPGGWWPRVRPVILTIHTLPPESSIAPSGSEVPWPWSSDAPAAADVHGIVHRGASAPTGADTLEAADGSASPAASATSDGADREPGPARGCTPWAGPVEGHAG